MESPTLNWDFQISMVFTSLLGVKWSLISFNRSYILFSLASVRMSLRCLFFFFHGSTESCEECSRTSIVIKYCRGQLDCTKSNQRNDSTVLCTLQKRKRMLSASICLYLLSVCLVLRVEKEAEHAL